MSTIAASLFCDRNSGEHSIGYAGMTARYQCLISGGPAFRFAIWEKALVDSIVTLSSTPSRVCNSDGVYGDVKGTMGVQQGFAFGVWVNTANSSKCRLDCTGMSVQRHRTAINEMALQ